MSHPSSPIATDALGARPRQPLQRAADAGGATITLYEDDPALDLFAGTGGAFPGYETYETLAGVAPGARLRSAAGAEAGVPVIAAWQLGDGLAIHTGLPQLVARARQDDPDAASLIRRIWQILGAPR